MLVQVVVAQVIEHHELSEHVGVQVGGFLGGVERLQQVVILREEVPHAEAGGDCLRERTHDHAVGQRGAADVGQRVALEAQLAVGVVFHYHDVAAGQHLAHLLAILGGVGEARGILEVRDEVDHLRAGIECRVQLVDVQALFGQFHLAEDGLLQRERLNGSQVRGLFHDDAVALVQQHLAEQVEHLLRAGGHEHVLFGVVGAEAVVVALGDPGAQLGHAGGDGVLEGLRAALGHHALHRFQQLFLWEGNGVRQAAGEGGHRRIGRGGQNGAHERRRRVGDAVRQKLVDGEFPDGLGGFGRDGLVGHGCCLRSVESASSMALRSLTNLLFHFSTNRPACNHYFGLRVEVLRFGQLHRRPRRSRLHRPSQRTHAPWHFIKDKA